MSIRASIGEVYRQCRAFFIPYFFVLAGCFMLRMIYTRNEIFFGINEWHGLFADRFFRVWTHIGDWLFVTIFVGVILLFSYRKAILTASCTITGTILGQLMKRLFHFPRPSVFYKGFLDNKGLPVRIYYVPDEFMLTNNSFPSGHTITAFTLALLCAYFVPKKWLSPVFLLLAILVAFSRMYLKQHFFEDTVAGSLVGVTVTLLLLCLLDARPMFRGENGDRGLLFKKSSPTQP